MYGSIVSRASDGEEEADVMFASFLVWSYAVIFILQVD